MPLIPAFPREFSMAMSDRPLSPHLQIWRWNVTMALSILHRATGILLSFGLLLLAGWLLALARGPSAYEQFAAFAVSWPVKLAMALLLVSFCYHFANGIRHLLWDMGMGLERRQARLSGRVVVVAVVLVSALLLYVFFAGGAAS